MENGTLHTIKCRIYTKVEGENKLFITKWGSFCKHAGRKKVLNNIGFNVRKRD